MGRLYDTIGIALSRLREKHGPRIVAVHAKDFVIKEGVKKGDLPAGMGDLDWASLLALLEAKKPGVDILQIQRCFVETQYIFTSNTTMFC